MKILIALIIIFVSIHSQAKSVSNIECSPYSITQINDKITIVDSREIDAEFNIVTTASSEYFLNIETEKFLKGIACPGSCPSVDVYFQFSPSELILEVAMVTKQFVMETGNYEVSYERYEYICD